MSFHAHSDGGLLYSENSRKIFGLDPFTSLCWLEFREEKSISEIERTLFENFEVDIHTCKTQIEHIIVQFSTMTQSKPEAVKIDSASGAICAHKTINNVFHQHCSYNQVICKQFDLCFSVQADDDDFDLLKTLLHPILNYENETPQKRLVVAKCDRGLRKVFFDNQLIKENISITDLITTLEGIINTKALAMSDYVIALHSALVSKFADGRQGVLLAGPSGSGKSTLSIAMGETGWFFGGDDLLILTDNLSVQSSRFSPCVKDGALAIIECYHPEINSYVTFNRFGRNSRYTSDIKQTCSRSDVSNVIFPVYGPAKKTELILMDRNEGLQTLLSQCMSVSSSFDHAYVTLLAQWHDRVDYYCMPFNSTETALQILDKLIT